MYKEPWAKLTTFMMPSTKVSPAETKNKKTPDCNPFRICSRSRVIGADYFRWKKKLLKLKNYGGEQSPPYAN